MHKTTDKSKQRNNATRRHEATFPTLTHTKSINDVINARREPKRGTRQDKTEKTGQLKVSSRVHNRSNKLMIQQGCTNGSFYFLKGKVMLFYVVFWSAVRTNTNNNLMNYEAGSIDELCGVCFAGSVLFMVFLKLCFIVHMVFIVVWYKQYFRIFLLFTLIAVVQLIS